GAQRPPAPGTGGRARIERCTRLHVLTTPWRRSGDTPLLGRRAYQPGPTPATGRHRLAAVAVVTGGVRPGPRPDPRPWAPRPGRPRAASTGSCRALRA